MEPNQEPFSVPSSAMVVFAHPDDAEFISAGTVALWAEQGCKVVYVAGTSGDKGSGDPDVDTQALIEIREQEQRDAADVLGVKEVEYLRYLDATLMPDLDLRLNITRLIRKHRPEALICQDPMNRYVGQEYIQHPDHIAMGEATLAAVFPSARDHLTFPQLFKEEGLEPHKVKHILLSGAREPDIWFDISSAFEKKVKALKAHQSQVGEWDPSDMLRRWSEDTAAEARKNRFPGSWDFKMAEAFKYFRMSD